MTEKPEKVTVHLKYKDAEETFQGTAEETWLLLNKFFSKFLPSFEIAQKLWLSVDLQQLAKECEGMVAFSPEGANVLVSKAKLTDNETLALWLLASYLGNKLGKLDSETLPKKSCRRGLERAAR